MADGDADADGAMIPDEAMIGAWLAGALSDADAAKVEFFFDENPGALPISPPVVEGDDETSLADLDTHRSDPFFSEVINRITGSAGEMQRHSRDEEAWREVLTPCDDEGLLGRIGDYDVIEKIAVGGMGIVFKGRDPHLNRFAALKVLAPDLAANATARERFLREARAAANLEHENVLPIYGVVEDGIPWFAMRYVGGGTLQDRLDRGEEFSIDFLKSLARQVAMALDAAHAQGIVHRDIKPANILFDDDGSDHLWVCDFGIARSAEDPSLTYPGAIAGTPRFMSPEQAEGGQLDGRSDLFSLGAVLYRATSGGHFFHGDTTAAVLRELGGDEPTRVDLEKSKLPQWFHRLLANLLAREPSDRPADAAAVVRAIDDEHSPPPRHRVRRNRRFALAAVVSVALLALVAGVSQVPFVEATVNQMLAARYPQAYFIYGRLGAWPDLRSAIAAAKDGDSIRLPVETPVAVDNLLIRQGKSLTLLSAVDEKRPQLTTEIAGSPGLVSRSPLRLVGIDFKINALGDSDGIVIVDGTTASVEDCQFVARHEVLKEVRSEKARAIELRGTASVDVVGCDFDLIDTNSITVLGPEGTIAVRNTRISGHYGIDLRGPNPGNALVSIDLQKVRFTGQSLLRVNPLTPPPRVEIAATNCRFTCARPLAWFVSADPQMVRTRTLWRGEDNVFPMGNAQVQVGVNANLHRAAALIPIGKFADPPVDFNRPGIVIKGSGETFEDLASAVERSRDGDTLLLSGTIECEKSVLVPRAKKLEIRAAPDVRRRPTVTAASSTDHAVFLLGAAKISGIRFMRHDVVEPSFPVIGFRAGATGEVVIEDCEFAADSNLPGGLYHAVGLSITDTDRTILRRCVFRGGNGLLAAALSEVHAPASIRLEECIFSGLGAIRVRSETDRGGLTIEAERCVVVGQNLVMTTPKSRKNRVRVHFRDSIIDLTGALFRLSDLSPKSGEIELSWQGRDNVYRRNMTAMTAWHRPVPSRAVVGTFIETLEQLVVDWPESSDSGARYGAPFDRAIISEPITTENLLHALQDGRKSSAVKTLKILAE